ncbi:MAG: SRPBCC family protein [Flavobacterium sp.]|nr:SRPBCC family protein [Flavobacterium sp.]
MILLYILGSLIGLILISALFIKKDYFVSREILIEAPLLVVFDYIKYLRNQENYGVWNSMDLNMKKTYIGTDGAPGCIYRWESEVKKVGAGEQEIKKITQNESLETELRFIKPFEGKAEVKIATAAVTEIETKVSWNMKSSMKYPMNFMLLFMNMDEMIGKDFAQGLLNLKDCIEK